jgi:hypothetical protein
LVLTALLVAKEALAGIANDLPELKLKQWAKQSGPSLVFRFSEGGGAKKYKRKSFQCSHAFLFSSVRLERLGTIVT